MNSSPATGALPAAAMGGAGPPEPVCANPAADLPRPTEDGRGGEAFDRLPIIPITGLVTSERIVSPYGSNERHILASAGARFALPIPILADHKRQQIGMLVDIQITSQGLFACGLFEKARLSPSQLAVIESGKANHFSAGCQTFKAFFPPDHVPIVVDWELKEVTVCMDGDGMNPDTRFSILRDHSSIAYCISMAEALIRKRGVA